MTRMTPEKLRLLTLGISSVVLTPFALLAQEEQDESVFNLPEFIVDGSQDRGYQVTNTVSGTSLNIAIRDLPMAMEVITSAFLEDTGATNFSEALTYSTGVFTEQYVQSAAVSTDGANSPGANEVSSGDRSASSRGGLGGRFGNGIIIRGFNVGFQNVDGFRYGGTIATYGVNLGGIVDTLNTERMEVVKGPNSLLYGIGVLSGIVNIIPKRPSSEFNHHLSLAVGEEGFRRFTFETTGPLKKEFLGGVLEYRLATSQQERGSWTQFSTQDQEYYVGQLQYRSKKWFAIAELQYADSEHRGVGAQHLYDNLNFAIDTANRNEYGEQRSWTKDLGGLPQSFRLTGPDTYHTRQELNFRANIDFMPTEDLTISAGTLLTEAEEEQFDVNISTITQLERGLNLVNFVEDLLPDPNVPEEERAKIQDFVDRYVTIDPVRQEVIDSLAPGARGVTDEYRTVRYWWRNRPLNTETQQFRIRMVYNFETPFLFDEPAEHTLLLGRHDIKDRADFVLGTERISSQFNPGDEFAEDIPLRFRRIDDFSPIRYEGEPLAMPGRSMLEMEQWFTGHYALYQGRYFNKKLTLITGLRHDRYQEYRRTYSRINQLEEGIDISSGIIPSGLIINPDNQTQGLLGPDSSFPPERGPNADGSPEKVVTGMLAVSYELHPAVSVYGLLAEGVTPNTGLRDGNDEAIESERGLSREIGLKFDALEGKISGSIAYYNIRRENAVWNFRHAPAPAKWAGSGNPDLEADPIRGFNPEQYDSGEFPIAYVIDSSYFPFQVGPVPSVNPETGRRELNLPDAVLSIESGFNNTVVPQELIHLDYTNLDDQAVSRDGTVQPETWRHYLEKAFADTEKSRVDGVRPPGPDDINPITYSRNVTGDGMNTSLYNATGANVTYTDEAEGVDVQVFLNPTPNLQVMLNYAYTSREAVTPFDLESTGAYGTEYDIWVRTFGREAFGLQEWDIDNDGVVDYVTKAGEVGENPSEEELRNAQVGVGDVDAADLASGLQGTSLFFGSEHNFSFWTRYRLNEFERFKDVVLGFGGVYTGPAQTSIAVGNEDMIENRFRTPPTPARWNFNAMIQYHFEIGDSRWNIRLNVSNLFDKRYDQRVASYDDNGIEVLRRTERYYAPRTWRITLGGKF